jgi:hypothetical protein
MGCPDLACGVASNASRTAVPARRCASLDNPGGAARYGKPHTVSPALVNQTQRGPRLSTAVCAIPAVRQRETCAAVRRAVAPITSAS